MACTVVGMSAGDLNVTVTLGEGTDPAVERLPVPPTTMEMVAYAFDELAIHIAARAIGGDFEGDVGGNCPVQGDGTVDGHPWYFRARGAAWTFDIAEAAAADPVDVGWGTPGWCAGAKYGTWPEAGWMSLGEAWAFIYQAVADFRAGKLPYVGATKYEPITRRTRAARKYARAYMAGSAYHGTRKRQNASRRLRRLLREA